VIQTRFAMAVNREDSIEKQPLVGDVDEDVSMLNPNPASHIRVQFSKGSPSPAPIPTPVFVHGRRSPPSKKWVFIFSLIVFAICIVSACILVELFYLYAARMSHRPNISHGSQAKADRSTMQPGVPGENEKAVRRAGSAIALRLFNQLTQSKENGGKNLFFSPLSVGLALGMVHFGARAKTATEIAGSMELDLSKNEADLRQLLGTGTEDLIGTVSALGQRGIKLNTANAFFVQKDYALLSEYVAALLQYFYADANAVDFAGDAEKLEAARAFINKYVSDHTNQMIPELLAQGVLNPLTRLVLINTVYFKGNWSSPFQKAATADQPFFTSASDKQNVKMMHKSFKIPFHHDEEHQVSVGSLKYNLTGPNTTGEVMEMVIVLPDEKDGLSKLEEKIQQEPILLWKLIEPMDRVPEVKTEIALPRFKFEQTMDLKSQLQQMGIKNLFSQADADLSGVTGKRDLFVSAAIHRAVVEVNEEGTEAAAATGMVMMLRAAMMVEHPPKLICDHPFLFVIRSRSTKYEANMEDQYGAAQVVYFVGRYSAPN
jgi:serine protease inhibitor